LHIKEKSIIFAPKNKAMYINRQIDADLSAWKNSPRRKPLLLRGARQVGKSSSIRHLASSFRYYIEVNFEKQPELSGIFDTADVKDITTKLSQYFTTPIVEGETLLFLDEIQACPGALKSLWFFKEDMPGLHVAAAGSLLEFALKEIRSFGVGRIRSLFMYPLSFDEFLIANGKASWVEAKKQASHDKPLFEALHSSLVNEFRKYLLVGGMPASVAAWIDTNDFSECAAEQEDIQQSYYDDFPKYADKVPVKLLRDTLHSVVVQTGKKFVYRHVEGGHRPEDIQKALNLLCDAGIIKAVMHTAANGLPLGAETNEKFCKYIYLDSGLLLRIFDLNLGGSKNLTDLILTGAAEDLVNKGAITEMVAGWELVKYSSHKVQHSLFYWENLKNGTTSEVDYIIAKDLKVMPIEVKSGTSGKMKSLRLFMKSKHLTEAIRTSLENFGKLDINENTDDGSTVCRHINICPLYALSNITEDSI